MHTYECTDPEGELLKYWYDDKVNFNTKVKHFWDIDKNLYLQLFNCERSFEKFIKEI